MLKGNGYWRIKAATDILTPDQWYVLRSAICPNCDKHNVDITLELTSKIAFHLMFICCHFVGWDRHDDTGKLRADFSPEGSHMWNPKPNTLAVKITRPRIPTYEFIRIPWTYMPPMIAGKKGKRK